MGETSLKKEKEKKKARARQEKEQKMKDRKFHKKGTSLEDMMAYIDENGNISSTPPDPGKKLVINAEDIQLSMPRPEEEIKPREGVVAFFNENKGFGFITDLESRQNVFVHINNLRHPLKENDKVTFDIEHTKRGLNAINVTKK
jgi:cold shock CspA family protein